jgi:hypothetical protein
MGNLLGRRHGSRALREVAASPEAVYLRALANLGTVMFDPELRTAAELVGLSATDVVDRPVADDTAKQLKTASWTRPAALRTRQLSAGRRQTS